MHFLLKSYLPALLLAAIAVADLVPGTRYSKWKKRADTFEWGVIGDSWATGVSAKDGDNYKGEKVCLRTNYAYGPQLETDNSWTHGPVEQFNFAACSGARLVDMAAPAGGQQQIKNTGSPHLIVMTAGGNNAGFYDIAINCIYQDDNDKDYGPEFKDDPDGVGACAHAVKRSHDYITDSLGFDLKATIADIVDSSQAHSHLDFFLYVTGYAHFFAVDDDWCDSQSFGARLKHKPKLSLPLRKAMNDLTEQLNNVYRQIIQDFPHPRIRYISITEGFNGHRFCETPSNEFEKLFWFSYQYYGTRVWFWNLSLPQTDSADETTPVESFELQGGLFTFSDGSSDGWQQRPFHPKAPGFTVIKDAIIAQMDRDKVPQSQPQCTAPTGAVSPSVDQANAMNGDLNAAGDKDCCSNEAGGCGSIASNNGFAVVLCKLDGPPECIPCSAAANYLAGLIATCTKDGMVSGIQDINGKPALTIQV